MNRRSFKINDVKYSITNRNNSNYEYSKNNQKYTLNLYSAHYQAWLILGQCNSLNQGYEIALTNNNRNIEMNKLNKLI